MGSYSVAFTSAEKVWVLWKKGVGQHNETGEALGGSLTLKLAWWGEELVKRRELFLPLARNSSHCSLDVSAYSCYQFLSPTPAYLLLPAQRREGQEDVLLNKHFSILMDKLHLWRSHKGPGLLKGVNQFLKIQRQKMDLLDEPVNYNTVLPLLKSGGIFNIFSH